MLRFHAVWLVAILSASHAVAEPPKPWVTGLKNPRAVAVGPDGRVYVTVCEEPEKAGTGAVMAIENGKAVPFAKGLDVPQYLTAWKDWIFVTDKECVWRIDRKGKAERFVRMADLPEKFGGFRGICVDEEGTLYAAAGGDSYGLGGKGTEKSSLFRISLRGKTELVFRGGGGSGIAMDGKSHLLMAGPLGFVTRLNLADGLKADLRIDPVVMLLNMGRGGERPRTVPACGGLVWDHHGRLYVAGDVDFYVVPRPGQMPVGIFGGEGGLLGGPCLSPDGKSILIPVASEGFIVSYPMGDPKSPVDETPLPLATKVAFPDLQWSGWSGETPAGKPNPLRPLVLTHANDNSGRNFVATQHGVIHVFPNDQAATKTKVFLDIQSKVRYDDKSNEEGFLGLAFHPDYQRTGEFFVFYTEKTAGHNNVLSRFHVSKDDPDRADPASEEVLLRVQHKYWNHDGGTVVFGPDGFLYLALGDGGLGNDPDSNGQNVNTLLGKIIRIDVNSKEEGKPYGIPKDNPFVGRKDARPEVYAYGLRNVWRMAFDRQTGRLWAADVGQNLYEEIDLIEKGGNYGWGIREGLHPFGPKGVGPRPDLIDPIWEYDHEVGKSITGGAVYRGQQFPELSGHYLYADYVAGKIWALRYDEKAKRVVANRPIADRKLPIMSFGEDDRGELYLMTYAQSGQGIYRFKRSGEVGSAK